MTRTVMRVAVSTQTKITIFFSVGRCVMSVEIRDPTADSVTLPGSPSSVTDGDVELCVAGEDRVCGSPPPSRHRDATRKVKAAWWNVLMVMMMRMVMVVAVVVMLLEGTRLSCH